MVADSVAETAPARVADVMPNFYANRGIWEGTHRVLDGTGRVTEESVRCVEVCFPAEDDCQHISRALGPDVDGGRAVIGEVRGRLHSGRLWWDESSFSGRAWDTDGGITLLEVTRKDDPGLSFRELITLSACRRFRTRTLHWYRDGASVHRTICDETRIDD